MSHYSPQEISVVDEHQTVDVRLPNKDCEISPLTDFHWHNLPNARIVSGDQFLSPLLGQGLSLMAKSFQ